VEYKTRRDCIQLALVSHDTAQREFISSFHALRLHCRAILVNFNTEVAASITALDINVYSHLLFVLVNDENGHLLITVI
jgi:hypothetical protein